jgi:hypothetical protein
MLIEAIAARIQYFAHIHPLEKVVAAPAPVDSDQLPGDNDSGRYLVNALGRSSAQGCSSSR